MWVFRVFKRGAKKSYLTPVERRDTSTLLGIISENVLPGTRIISDGWAVHRQLNNLGYSHAVIKHSLNFVSLDDS